MPDRVVGDQEAVVRLLVALHRDRQRQIFLCVIRNELVRGVVLVGGDEKTAAEAGTGLADGAAERVVVRTTPTRRVEDSRAFDRF